ncbi:MAG: class I SAM-dependent RNA methyltransferase, partial [Anaerolineales bacterium]|nr:class I SAM-dependent RNA methyltransferase [Anaerolineales bacterium]
SFKLFAACAPGLETCVAQELQRLNVADAHAVTGGVNFNGPLEDVSRANMWLRTASRVLVRVGGFRVTEFWQLHKWAAKLEWGKFLRPGQPIAIRATCHKSKLYHSNAVAERVAKAIGESLGKAMRVEIEKGEEEHDGLAGKAQLVVVRLEHDWCTLSVDSSGELLHKRGYRLAVAKAPLRETLAAGMVLLAEWDGASTLIDPFCGSGTIAIEAAWLAQNQPPGAARQFAFTDWPIWSGVKNKMPVGAVRERPLPAIFAYDRDAGAIEAAHANAERAGVASHITFVAQAVSHLQPPPGPPGLILTNPPYGVRVSEREDVRNLYAAFGKILRERFTGWRVAFLCSDDSLAHATDLPLNPNQATALVNGGLRVKLWRVQL